MCFGLHSNLINLILFKNNIYYNANRDFWGESSSGYDPTFILLTSNLK